MGLEKGNEMLLCPKSISHYRQNKPTLIAKDLERYGVPRNVTYRILLARGIFKWLAKRRDLIKLKIEWRKKTTRVITAIQIAKAQKNYGQRMYWKGYLKSLERCREDVEKICHSDRWTVPDNDSFAADWFDEETEFIGELRDFGKRVGVS